MQALEQIEQNFTGKNIVDVLKGYLVAAIWQDGGLDEFSIYDIDDQDVKTAFETCKDFVQICCDNFCADIVRDDPDQFGHSLLLQSMGHGSGFYDLEHKQADQVSALLDNLSNTRLIYKPDHVVQVDGKIYLNFCK